MRLIDADELTEMVWRERVDTRERIANLIARQPTIEQKKPTIEQKSCTNCKWYTVLENHLKEDMPVCRHEVAIDYGTELKVYRCVFYEPKER